MSVYSVCTIHPVQLFNYQVLSLVYMTVYLPYLLPPIFLDYFTLTASVHTCNVRHKKLYLSQVNTYFVPLCQPSNDTRTLCGFFHILCWKIKYDDDDYDDDVFMLYYICALSCVNALLLNSVITSKLFLKK